MKIKLHLLLLAALSLGAAPLHAGLFSDPLGICGGADDDQFHPSPPGVHAPDFDALWNQAMSLPEHKGMTIDPLGIPPPPAQPAPAVHLLERLPSSEIIAILIGLHGDDDSDTLGDLESDPLGLTPAQAGLFSDLGRIVGGDGADFNNPARRDRIESLLLDYLFRRPDFIGQICGGNGNDSLWGDNGTDSLRMNFLQPAAGQVSVPITGDGGADSIYGAEDLENLWLRMISGAPEAQLWGGGGTDEIREKPIDRPLDQ